MLAQEMTFRELDRKWFLLENEKDIKRMHRLFHLKNKKYPILVYSYIDHECGLSMRVLSTIEVEDKEAFLDKKRLDKRLDILRYSEMEKLHLTPVPIPLIKKIRYTDQVVEEMDAYYKDYPKVVLTRDEVGLDNYRDPVIPDNVKFLVITPDHKKEFLEGKITDYDDEKQYYTVTVLENPKQDFDIQIGDSVLLKYVDRPNYKGLAFMKKRNDVNP